jgi:hypothetical protein
VIDLLLWIAGEDFTVERYRDDDFGGVEANAVVEATVGDVEARIELSDTRDLGHYLRVRGDRATVEAGLFGGRSVSVEVHDDSLSDLSVSHDDDGRYSDDWGEQIELQVEDFARSILDDEIRYVPGTSDLRVVEFVHECYDAREPLVQPWEALHVEGLSAGSGDPAEGTGGDRA